MTRTVDRIDFDQFRHTMGAWQWIPRTPRADGLALKKTSGRLRSRPPRRKNRT